MFTAVVLMCAQTSCMAVGGPAFKTQEQCAADFMLNGVPALQRNYPGYEIVEVECRKWEEKVKS